MHQQQHTLSCIKHYYTTNSSETLVEIVANIISIESKNVIQGSMSRDVRITEIRSWNEMYCMPSSVVSDHRITMIVFYR